MTKIEEVARAMWEHDKKYNAALEHPIVPFEVSDYMDSARAAVEAMRLPNHEMIVANLSGDYEQFWDNMISAILNEKPGGGE